MATTQTPKERAAAAAQRLEDARKKEAAGLRKVVESELKKIVGSKVSFTDDSAFGNVDAYAWMLDAIQAKKDADQAAKTASAMASPEVEAATAGKAEVVETEPSYAGGADVHDASSMPGFGQPNHG